ncbi:MAG: serine hydrolase domain-containing protein [Dehalococcoidia bacterium]
MTHAAARGLTILACAATIASGASAQEHRFPRAEPARLGMDAQLLARAGERADAALPALLSLAILKRDTLVFERYFHGGADTTGFNVKSVAKSILSALVGIARREGFVPDLDRTLASIFPEHFARPPAPPRRMYRQAIAQMDSARSRITLRHILTMSTGQEWEENGLLTNAFLMSSNPVRFGLELAMEAMPGETFHYNTGATHVLSAALTRLTGSSLPELGERYLFGPAGIVLKGWDVDPQGIAVGGAEMYFTTRGMLRFGQLYHHEGMLEGAQIVPRDWVRESLTVHRRDVTDNFKEMIPGLEGYGYLWWPRRVGDATLWCALGLGGQFVVVDQSRDLVVAGTSALDCRSPGTLAQMKLIWKLLDELVLPAA